MFITAFALGFLAASPLAATDAVRMQAPTERTELAVAALSQGNSGEAIDVLSRAHAADRADPAVLINLGIAHAHRGEDAAAQAMFRAALASPVAYDVDTADGTAMDTRKLARRALRMLERGEFRGHAPQPSHLTLRD